MATFDEVLVAVHNERRFQDDKWGSIASNPHDFGTWFILIEAELAEAKEALIKGGSGRNSLRNELIQVAALCFAALEQHGVKDSGEGRSI